AHHAPKRNGRAGGTADLQSSTSYGTTSMSSTGEAEMSDSLQSWLQPALSVMLGDRGTCDIRFSLQGAYVSDDLADDLRLLGIDDTVVTINGSALNASKEIEEADFVDVSDAALARIRNRFTAYLEGRGLPRASPDGSLLDIEGQL